MVLLHVVVAIAFAFAAGFVVVFVTPVEGVCSVLFFTCPNKAYRHRMSTDIRMSGL